MSRAAEKLESLVNGLEAGQLPSPKDTEFLARTIRHFITTPSRSRDTLLTQEDRRERDQHLTELARRYCQHLPSVHAKARQILKWSARYEASGWLIEQHSAVCPARRIGKPEEHIWRAFVAGGVIPSLRQLQKILKKSLS